MQTLFGIICSSALLELHQLASQQIKLAMEAMRSAARIKSGCKLLSGVGNEAPQLGGVPLLEAFT